MVYGVNPLENQNVLKQTEAFIAERQEWLLDGVEAVTGAREGNPLEIFPEPSEVRADDEGLELTSEQETKLRQVAGEFGIGGEADVMNGAVHQVIEGGKAWKIEAEAKLVTGASTVLFAGSPNRTIGQDEAEFMQTKLPEGVEPAVTEFDLARQIAELQPGFEPLEKDKVLPFGYDMQEGYAVTDEATGQLVVIGKLNGADVVLFRVDREDYVDEEGADKYRQPDGAAVVGIVADVLVAAGDEESSVGLNTSNTYASRAIDTVRAGLHRGRSFTVGMYGRQTLADVQGKDVAAPTDINQIPGELHVMAVKLAQLEAELHG